ncbi:MAG: hypothetical protein QM813_27570 [Verrucomicrobiota bacterium]
MAGTTAAFFTWNQPRHLNPGIILPKLNAFRAQASTTIGLSPHD